MDSLYDKSNNKFYPENQGGNIEYKWRLDTKNELGHKKLISQMMWRINEGYEIYGEKKAGYLLGVYDNGKLGKLSVDELIKSINILKNIISKIELIILNEEIKQINDSYIYYCDIIQKNIEIKYKEKNLIIIGDSQSGKTTLISQFCYNNNHKKFILKHEHEKNAGITTDIKKEIIGIKNNNIINYCDYSQWNDIAINSDIIINIYDIPVLNIKTIITYLLGISPDYIIICYKDNINSHNIQFYKDFCDIYKINNNFVKYTDIINYDKDYFNKILLELSRQNNIESSYFNSNLTTIFRILDYYDIPEKGLIVSGIVKNNMIKINDILYLHISNEYTKIKITSINKKTLSVDELNEDESGSLNITFLGDKKKITKHAYITNYNTIDNLLDNLLDNQNNFNFKSHKKINNGNYNVILFNCNFNINADIEIQDNIIIFKQHIKLQDKKIILHINDNKSNLNFDNLYLIYLS